MFGTVQPPATPDYTGAALAQGAAAQGLTEQQTYANRPDITTPWGTMQWTPPPPKAAAPPFAYSGPSVEDIKATLPDAPGVDNNRLAQGIYQSLYDQQRNKWQTEQLTSGGQPGRWGMRLTLSPEQQAALESQQRITGQRSSLAEQLFGRAQGELGAAPDFSSLPAFPTSGGEARNRAEEAIYGRSKSRLDPEWQQRQQELDINLRNQGIMPGSEMYQRQMSNFERAREQAYSGARQESIIGGGAEESRQFGLDLTARQSAIAEMLQKRGWTLNEIQALLSGQQIGMPQMPGFNQAGVSQAPNLLGALSAQDQAAMQRYGISQAQLQSMMGGATQLAALPFMF